MVVARPALVSEEQFLALPESMEKLELLDGEVIVSPAPTFWHQETLRRLLFALGAWGAGRPVTIGQSPCDIRFAPSRILQPDAFVILDRVPRDQVGPLTRVPEICVEVLSGNRAHDRVTKRLVYAGAGVHELWIAEPQGLIERWRGVGLAEADEIVDHLTTPLLPGFTLDVRALFAA